MFTPHYLGPKINPIETKQKSATPSKTSSAAKKIIVKNDVRGTKAINLQGLVISTQIFTSVPLFTSKILKTHFNL